ncbi:TPA: DEAD/DEAH box helicase [Vibrio parahaemolyticus]
MLIKECKLFDNDLHCLHFITDGGKSGNWNIGEEVTLVRDNDNLVVAQRNTIALVSASELKTTEFAGSGLSLWRLAKRSSDHVHLQHISVQRVLSIDLNITIDGYISEQIYKAKLIPEQTSELARKWLDEEFILQRSEPWLFARSFQNNQAIDLQLIGRKYSLTVFEDSGVWKAKTLTRFRRDDREILAISGLSKFVDGSIDAQLKNGTIDLLNQQIRDTGSYLSLWQTYSDLQWNIATRTAKKLGSVRYENCFHSGGETPVFRFNVGTEQANEFLMRLKELQESDDLGIGELTLEISDEEPEWLLDDLSTVDKAKGARPLLGRDLKVRPPYVDLEVKQKRPPRKGCLYLSIQGDKSVHDRRERAYRSIQKHSNPMPQLRLLLEGIESPSIRRRTIRTLSNKASKRFKGEPTQRQKKALEIALNTPDVALIIGPPGTGKTQVISALQQRIADESSSGRELKHQVLVTSFQHDAVDNVVERSGLFGLPAIKIGGRRFGGDASEGPIAKWRLSKLLALKSSLEAELDSWPVFKRFHLLCRKLLELRVSRDIELRRMLALDTDVLLKELANEDSIHLTGKVSEDWDRFLDKQVVTGSFSLSSSDRERLLIAIRGIRITATSFADDGNERLMSFLVCAERFSLLSLKLEIENLEEVLQETIEGKEPDRKVLDKLSKIQDQLLDKLRPDYRPALLRSYMNEADCRLLDNVESNVHKSIKSSKSLGSLMVRLEYLKTIEAHGAKVESSIKDYVSVIGSTCQQAAGDQMLELKDSIERQGISFDTVVVDEAARANPLDLMIPMSMAKRRIVLVGDHLQLPHMLEPRVESELQEQGEIDAVESELLKISLFEYLHGQFVEMHKKGGPQRVVMLDTQFRMHPQLGAFVSREFYERRGFESIESGLSEDSFEHNIPSFQGKVAAWIDVPKSEGKEQKIDGSRWRYSEAKRCAEEASKILNSSPETSVGLITFYSAQRDAIYKELETYGFVQLNEDGWEVSPDYKLTSSGDERLRVGSVDAFQGKEFDVVLLSSVRTWTPKENITPDILNRELGFLRLPNRINVAMSRQKKLLIVVGDKQLGEVCGVDTDTDSPYLPGFPSFLDLCGGSYGRVL